MINHANTDNPIIFAYHFFLFPISCCTFHFNHLIYHFFQSSVQSYSPKHTCDLTKMRFFRLFHMIAQYYLIFMLLKIIFKEKIPFSCQTSKQKIFFDIKFRIAIRHSNTSKFATESTILKSTEIIKFHFYINIKTSSPKNKMKKARTSVSLCQNSPTVFQPRIQNQEISAFTIKFEAYSHFLEMVSKNQQKLISSYTNSMLEQYELFKQFDRSSQQDTQKVQDQTKCSLLNNSMFMLKIQNQKLRCKEKLLQQKLECQKILFRKRRQEGGFLERERRMKIEEIRLLKEEVTALQSIIQKKKSLQIAQGRQRCLMAYLPMVKDIVKQYSPENAEKLLLKILSELQNQQIN